MPIFKKGKKEDAGNYRQVSRSLMTRKVMKQIALETVSKHMKDKKVTGRSKYGVTKMKSCLMNYGFT